MVGADIGTAIKVEIAVMPKIQNGWLVSRRHQLDPQGRTFDKALPASHFHRAGKPHAAMRVGKCQCDMRG